MSDYRCPDCGGRMHTFAKLVDPPIYEARCWECSAIYQREPIRDGLIALPRDYQRVEKAREA